MAVDRVPMLEVEIASVDRLLETAWSERRRGNHVAALEAFQAAAALDRNRSGIQVELACELRLLGRLDGAEAVLAALLAIEPDNAGALVERAHLLRQRGDRVGAAASFRAAAALSPGNIPLRLELVRELRAIGQLDETEEELSLLLRIEPGNVAASVERGHVRRRRADHVGAAMAFGAAAAAETGNLDVRLEFARELRAAERLDEAEAVLGALLGADPHRVGTLVERAYLSRQRGDRARVVADFEAALGALAPGDSKAVDIALQLASELRDQDRREDALGLIEPLVEQHPDNLSAWLQRGEILRDLGDHAQARESFRRALRQNPNHIRSLVALAREHWLSGSPRMAWALLNRALHSEPYDFAALMAAAEQALESENSGRALQFAREAIAHHPGQLTAYLLGARAAARFDRAVAEELVEQAHAIFGPRAEIIATKVHVLRTYRDYGAARAAIERSGTLTDANLCLWSEATSLMITMGDFVAAESALAAPPVDRVGGAACVHGLRGQLAQARRDYVLAGAHYREALACDGERREWRAELARCCLLLADMKEARKQLGASMAMDGAETFQGDLPNNISQHALGPLFDEFMLDPSLLERLKRIRDLPPNDQIARLEECVRQCPDHTGPALLLLLAMRQGEMLETASPEFSPLLGGAIPKRIVQYWHDREPPADVKALMSSWPLANPEYEYRLFDSETAFEFLRTRAPSGAVEAFRRAGDIPQQVDIFRLAYLAAEGGFFVDADDRCQTPLEGRLPAQRTFIGYQEQLGSLGANFIGAAKRHPVILRALALAVEAVNRGDHDIAWLSTGPGLLTRAFAQALIDSESEKWRPWAVVLESHALHRLVGVHCPTIYKSKRQSAGVAEIWREAPAIESAMA